MADPFQVGDIFVLGKLAWDLYDYGFNPQLKASRQYTEFFQDVKNLARNLENLARVVDNATSQLQTSPLGQLGQLAQSNRLWDLTSFHEILGDYEQTIRHCYKLLRDNAQYNNATSPGRSIAFNILVQPDVDRLRDRISLHNTKLLFLLKPFEMDLLLRVHQDLASRMTNMHNDLRRLMGVMVPSFEEEMQQQAIQQTFTLDVPAEFALRFQQAAEINHPELAEGGQFPLADTASAFAFHFRKSTRGFVAARFEFLERRTVSPAAYVNLLKCIWLMSRLNQYQSSQLSGSLSHWPSYLKGLNQELSQECRRFSPESLDRIFAPDLSQVRLDTSAFAIWPEPPRPSHLPSGHNRKFMMKEITTVPLHSDAPSVSKSLRFLQVLNEKPSQYRLIAMAEERLSNGTIVPEERIIDIDLESACFAPLYAMPTFNRETNDILLRTPSQDTKFSFPSLKDLLRFQQAFTGFKPYRFYSQSDVKVTFMVSGVGAPIIEDAVVQFWMPKRLEGQLVNEEEGSIEEFPVARRESMPSSPFSPTSPTRTFSAFSSSSPNYFSARNPFTGRPVDQVSLGSLSSSTPPLGSSPGSLGSSDLDRRTTASSTRQPSNQQRRTTFASVSSRASQSTVTVLDMGDTNGFLHEKPLRPTLVIFSRRRGGANELSITSIKINDNTAVNTERCDCRKPNSPCATTAIEQKKGKKSLEAQRFVANTGMEGFDLGKLGMTRRRDYPHAEFKGLNRVSITFKDAIDRGEFGGFRCHCKLNTLGDLKECIKSSHQGLFGEVKAVGQKELRAYHRASEDRPNIVIGQSPSAVRPYD
ncbi:hypothetical protein FQN55_004379 [Onygenales sp. PD_40]|nr:hypothetical protein FQN55_004379 [Onygenales sp. PD_40]KAK2788963.1 hypothetical protein FQN53_002777 [Emmonsiellopsis sp. PD_33]KAK2796141.1 hypothetical protein FQN52_000117 [Onygenales sp. PD_12]